MWYFIIGIGVYLLFGALVWIFSPEHLHEKDEDGCKKVVPLIVFSPFTLLIMVVYALSLISVVPVCKYIDRLRQARLAWCERREALKKAIESGPYGTEPLKRRKRPKD